MLTPPPPKPSNPAARYSCRPIRWKALVPGPFSPIHREQCSPSSNQQGSFWELFLCYLSAMRKKLLLLSAVLLALCGAVVADDFQKPARIHLSHEGERWAQKTLKKLSLEEKIGQIFMVRVLTQFMDVQNPDYLKLHDQIARYHLGSILLTVPSEGPFLYKSGPYEATMLVNQLQRDSKA